MCVRVYLCVCVCSNILEVALQSVCVCVGLSSGGALQIESGGVQSSLYSNNHTTAQVAQAHLGFLIPGYK